MKFQLKSGAGPVDESTVAHAEHRLGVRFPAGYRDFLLSHGSGRPKPGGFDITWRPGQAPAEDWRRSSVAWLYFVDGDEEESLALANLVDFRGRLPADTMAIGRDPSGNQLLLALAGPYAGHLLFWCKDHEAGDGNVPGWDNVGQVAASFQDFVDRVLG